MLSKSLCQRFSPRIVGDISSMSGPGIGARSVSEGWTAHAYAAGSEGFSSSFGGTLPLGAGHASHPRASTHRQDSLTHRGLLVHIPAFAADGREHKFDADQEEQPPNKDRPNLVFLTERTLVVLRLRGCIHIGQFGSRQQLAQRLLVEH